MRSEATVIYIYICTVRVIIVVLGNFHPTAVSLSWPALMKRSLEKKLRVNKVHFSQFNPFMGLATLKRTFLSSQRLKFTGRNNQGRDVHCFCAVMRM